MKPYQVAFYNASFKYIEMARGYKNCFDVLQRHKGGEAVDAELRQALGTLADLNTQYDENAAIMEKYHMDPSSVYSYLDKVIVKLKSSREQAKDVLSESAK